MPFERELERKINKKPMGSSLGKLSGFLFLSARLQKSEGRRERRSRVMEKNKHDKGKRLDIQSKKQKNRESDRERLCWFGGIRYSLFSN